jgi:hypothetical protein
LGCTGTGGVEGENVEQPASKEKNRTKMGFENRLRSKDMNDNRISAPAGINPDRINKRKNEEALYRETKIIVTDVAELQPRLHVQENLCLPANRYGRVDMPRPGSTTWPLMIVR